MKRTLVATFVLAALAAGCRRRRPEATTQLQPGAVPGMAPASGMQGGAIMPNGVAAGGAQAITVGGMASGALQQGDMALQDGSVADNYNVMLQAGQPVTIVTRGGPSTSSPGSILDVYTVLMFNNQDVAHDDDGAANGAALNSRVVYTPVASGMYTVRVTTYGSGLKTGTYTLQIYPGALPQQL